MIETRESALADEGTWTQYGWIITRDLAASDLVPSRVGTAGPRSLHANLHGRLQEGQGIRFRLRDGDGELIYEGRFLGDANSEDGFAPLDDFGEPDAGCTSIAYKRDGGKWVQL